MNQTPSFTIVVPAFNEEEMIADCIRSIQNQTYAGSYEIIVVNNASTDNTKQIALSMGVSVIDEPKQGYVHALRAGFGAATADIIACTDADTHVPPAWLEKITENLSQKNTVACSGIFEFYDGNAFIHYIGKAFGKWNYHLAGANMAVWRHAYLKSGGFNVHVNMGADVDLGQRLHKIGNVFIDRKLIAQTSGRRFQYAFFQTLFLYYLNDLWLLILRRPLFYNFPNIRTKKSRTVFYPSKMAFARFGIAALMIFGFLWISENSENKLFGTVFAHGEKSLPLVALTFDDGPSIYTAELLDTLSKYNVKATFFLVGNNVDKYPALAKRIVAEGHAIGNHTYTHPFWGPLETPDLIHKEIDKTETSILAATGIKPDYFRPPHGWRSPWMMNLVRKENYTVVTWTVSPDDWQNISSATICQRVLSKCGSGSIVLLHDGIELKQDPKRQQTIKALPTIISRLHERGYQFVTIPQLIEASDQFMPSRVALLK